MEKYMAFKLGNHLMFIDSFQFMSSSLDKLVNPIPHGEGGGALRDSALLQIVFFITSIRDAAKPRNLVTFPKI